MNRSLRAFALVVLFFAFVDQARAAESHAVTPDLVYGHKAGMALTCDMIQPKEPNGAAVLFMMSGGWVSVWIPPENFVSPAAPDGFKHFRELVDKGYTLFIVRHGSSPQFKVPEAVADVRRAVRYIRLNADKLGIDPDRIGVCGASAGGHLSMMLGTTADEGNQESADPVDRAGNRVAAVVAYFGPVDLREWLDKSDTFPALAFEAGLAESVSPLLHVSADDAPTLLIHGDQDALVTLDNSEQILAELQRHKVPSELLVIPGAGHGFPGEMGKRASAALIEWFDRHLIPADVKTGEANEAEVETAAEEADVETEPVGAGP